MCFKKDVFVSYIVVMSCIIQTSRCASAGQNFGNVNFSFRRNIPYYERNATLYSASSTSVLASYGRCAVKCIEDLSCHAIELCDVSDGTECRATNGLVMTPTSTNQQGVCKQYFMVKKHCLKYWNIMILIQFRKCQQILPE